jgi:hypothetical protein
MSQQPPPDRPAGEKEGLSKMMKRFGSALRRGSHSKRISIASLGGEGESSKAAVAKPTAPSPTDVEPPSTATRPTIRWSTVQQERARALFAKYGLTLEPDEWMSPRNLNVERVEKPIRMRVRRTCHRCQTTFGFDKVCVNCQHLRCKKCPRYPPVKSKENKDEKGKGRAVVPPKESLAPPRPRPTIPTLTLPSRRGGQDLVRKPITQRVRRTCHRCGTLFRGNVKECSGCQHIRCKKCPREPAKLDKYPDGYPGDADPPPDPLPRVWKKQRLRVRYFCHQCSTQYVPGERTCATCGEPKGSDTIRDPPKRDRPQPDPKIVERVQERLAQLPLGS